MRIKHYTCKSILKTPKAFRHKLLLFPAKLSSLRKLLCTSGKVIKHDSGKTSHLNKLGYLVNFIGQKYKR